MCCTMHILEIPLKRFLKLPITTCSIELGKVLPKYGNSLQWDWSEIWWTLLILLMSAFLVCGCRGVIWQFTQSVTSSICKLVLTRIRKTVKILLRFGMTVWRFRSPITFILLLLLITLTPGLCYSCSFLLIIWVGASFQMIKFRLSKST